MAQTDTDRRPLALAIFFIIAGVIGWIAAFALTIEKFALLTDPQESLGCDFSVLVQCSANLSSAQGAVLGFPNPIIGLGAWVAPIVVGFALLAGARFDRWFWIIFNVGALGAVSFVAWLISQSIFVLGTLCPWCMVTWLAAIPFFWVVTFRNAAHGVFGERPRHIGEILYRWVPTVTFASYLTIAILAQLRLDVINHI
ncbi:MAG: vitamin K epoxide reductase family protein [Microbacteriaceae bacterium]